MLESKCLKVSAWIEKEVTCLKICGSIKEEVTQLKVNVSTKLEVAFLEVIQQIRKLIKKKYIDIDPWQVHKHKKVLSKLNEVFFLQLATKLWSHFD